MAVSRNTILLFGGTFDPVHHGHMRTVQAVQDHWQFDRVIFLPCKIPVLKDQAQASPQQRLDMLHLALADYPDYPFECDARELQRDGPSYTVTTLEEYRRELGPLPSITWLMGMDSFLSLPRWHRWQVLPDMAHLLVMTRAGYPDPQSTLLQHELRARLTTDENALRQQPHGLIATVDAGSYDISSSAIRQQNNDNLPTAVQKYIKQHSLYTRAS